MQEISIDAQKRALRERQLALRAAIPQDERGRLDAALVREIARHPAFLAADALLLYAPVRGEPDLLPLFALAAKRAIPCAFPRCEGKEMLFCAVRDLSELEPGRFGILTPPKAAPVLTPSSKTLCVLPALAASKDGRRLGYGGGVYDRYLSRFSPYTLLGIYQALLTDEIPTEPTDKPADAVITEKGVLYRA